VEKLAELGVTHLHAVDTERAQWPARRDERWERLAVAALRQSRSAWRMSIMRTGGLVEAMAAAREKTRWLADPEGRPAAGFPGGEGPAVVAVGPAPGFSDSERKALRGSGFQPVRPDGDRGGGGGRALGGGQVGSGRRRSGANGLTFRALRP
jgi:RsmE family RNA methyltransferase